MPVVQFPNEGSMQYSTSYKLAVTTQLRRLYLLGLLAAREDQAEQLADAWSQTLWEAAVPIDLLPDHFQRAVELHRGPRGLNASEVIRVWQETNSQIQPPAAGCEACGGTGFVRAEPIIERGFSYSCVKPCGQCPKGRAKMRGRAA